MPIYDYKIGLQWNQPEGSLTNLEAISVPNTVLSVEDVFNRYEVDDNTHYLPRGRESVGRSMALLGDATITQNGREEKPISFMWVSDVALQYWIDTYEGKKVTFKTTKRQFNSYTRYNCTVGVAEYPQPEYKDGTWWHQDVRVPFYIQGTAT
jgi:V8-like Glu-specific endopeptidase